MADPHDHDIRSPNPEDDPPITSSKSRMTLPLLGQPPDARDVGPFTEPLEQASYPRQHPRRDLAKILAGFRREKDSPSHDMLR